MLTPHVRTSWQIFSLWKCHLAFKDFKLLFLKSCSAVFLCRSWSLGICQKALNSARTEALEKAYVLSSLASTQGSHPIPTSRNLMIYRALDNTVSVELPVWCTLLNLPWVVSPADVWWPSPTPSVTPEQSWQWLTADVTLWRKETPPHISLWNKRKKTSVVNIYIYICHIYITYDVYTIIYSIYLLSCIMLLI